LDVEHRTYECPHGHVVKWRRKVRSRFNEELGLWEPIPQIIQDEEYALVILLADNFVSLARSSDAAELGSHVKKTKEHFPSHQVVYLIEGLAPWMRKNRNIRNRQFTSAVRNQAEPSAPISSGSQQPSRRKKIQQVQEYIDEDAVEDALLRLQVLHDVLIHHTNASVETAQWIVIFTQHISTVPYRKQREEANAAGAGFCMESGQVRAGDDAKDTFVRMLQEIMRVTAPIAYGIAAEFGSVTKLVNGLEAGGPLTLEGCRKSANKDGAVTDRNIGQAISRRLHKVFTGRDHTSTDV
jgi:crossover junction endonuclease EME1